MKCLKELPSKLRLFLIMMTVRIFHLSSWMKKTIRIYVVFHFILFSISNLLKSRGICLRIIFSFFSSSRSFFSLPHNSFAFFLFLHCVCVCVFRFLSLPQFQAVYIKCSDTLCTYVSIFQMFTQRCQRYKMQYIYMYR